MTLSRKTDLHHPARLSALKATGLLDSSPDEAFDRLTRLATRIIHVPIALVSLVEETRQYFKSCIGLPEPWAIDRETPLTHSFCQHVVTEAAPLIIEDATQHPLVKDSLAIRDLGVIAYLGIPLITSEGHALGSFCVIDTQPRSWMEEEISLVTELASWAITEIELRRKVKVCESVEEIFRDLLFVDDLTGLYNRRAMGHFLGEEAERSRRFSHPLGLVMLDLDGFKAVNDRHGHQAGDEVLRRLSRVIKDRIRTVDRAIRYGGDEFMVVLPETDKAGAFTLAERLRGAFASTGVEIEGSPVSLTISVGVASMPEDATTVEELVKRADDALYAAKRRRGNATTVADAPQDTR